MAHLIEGPPGPTRSIELNTSTPSCTATIVGACSVRFEISADSCCRRKCRIQPTVYVHLLSASLIASRCARVTRHLDLQVSATASH
eukprot:14705-Heterococcus_DN1.PRE.4